MERPAKDKKWSSKSKTVKARDKESGQLMTLDQLRHPRWSPGLWDSWVWKTHINVRWLEWEKLPLAVGSGLLTIWMQPQYFFHPPCGVSLGSFHIRWLALGHPASEWQTQDSASGNLTQDPLHYSAVHEPSQPPSPPGVMYCHLQVGGLISPGLLF